MPGVRAFGLPLLRRALVSYAEKTSRRPSLEYALIDGVNDGPAELAALVGFCRGMLVHVNLIPVNSVPSSGFLRSPVDRLSAFARGLRDAGIEVSVRTERGSDIDAACGQLRQAVSRREG
jgi:23S rRNA (adenine2503-C2)-methyltransferase